MKASMCIDKAIFDLVLAIFHPLADGFVTYYLSEYTRSFDFVSMLQIILIILIAVSSKVRQGQGRSTEVTEHFDMSAFPRKPNVRSVVHGENRFHAVTPVYLFVDAHSL